MFKVGRQSASLEFSRPVGISLTTTTGTSETENESAFCVCAHIIDCRFSADVYNTEKNKKPRE